MQKETTRKISSPKLTLCTGDITTFAGDALICPSDIELTDHHTSIAKLVLEKGGKDLLREVNAIGWGSIGSTVIVRGYQLNVKHVIFLPVKDQSQEGTVIDQITLHMALRSAFTLADLYKVKTLAVPMLNPRITKKSSIFNSLLNNKPAPETMSDSRVLDIITAVAKDFAKSSLQEILIYRTTTPQNVTDLLPTKHKN